MLRLVVGVFARWVVGCGVFAWGVCVSWCWRSGGCAWFALLWPPCLVACLALTCRVWAALAWAVACAGWGGKVGAGQSCPAPTVWRAVPGCCVACGVVWRGVWGARRVLTRVRARRWAVAAVAGGGGVLARLARTILAPGSRGVVVVWCWAA